MNSMGSRSLDDLLPEVAAKFKEWYDAVEAKGVQLCVYCTYRSADEQDALYAEGRTTPGHIVTNAHGWESWHNFKRAIDVVPIRNGKLVWTFSSNDPLWKVMIDEARSRGIEWGGDWHGFKDYDHFQITDGLSFVAARKEMEGGGDATV